MPVRHRGKARDFWQSLARLQANYFGYSTFRLPSHSSRSRRTEMLFVQCPAGIPCATSGAYPSMHQSDSQLRVAIRPNDGVQRRREPRGKQPRPESVALPCPQRGARHVPEGPGGATCKDAHDCQDATALCRGGSRSLLNTACEVCTERSHRLARWSLRFVARQRNYPPDKPVAFWDNRCGLCSNEPNDPPDKPVGFLCPYAVYEFSPHRHSLQGRTVGGRGFRAY
jgi:hypothetical protein